MNIYKIQNKHTNVYSAMQTHYYLFTICPWSRYSEERETLKTAFIPPNWHRHREKQQVYAHTKRFSAQNSEENLRIQFHFINVCVDDVYIFVYIIWKNPIECRNTRPQKIGCPMKIYAVGVPVYACEPVSPLSLITFSYMHLLLLNIVDLSYHKLTLGNTLSWYFAVKDNAKHINNNLSLFIIYGMVSQCCWVFVVSSYHSSSVCKYCAILIII